MSDEVHDVVVLPPQHSLQRRQRPGRRGVDDDQVAPLQVGKGVSQPCALRVRVEEREVGGAGRQHQQPERGRDLERPDGAGQVEVADEGRPLRQREEQALVPAPQELPRHVRELGHVGEPEPHPEAGVAALGLGDAGGQRHPQLRGEQRVVQLRTEPLDVRRHGRSLTPAGRPARSPDPEQEVLQLELVPRQPEITGGAGSARRRQDPGPVAALVPAPLDEQIEVEVVEGAHADRAPSRCRQGAARARSSRW
jgi:hypothetical protein